MSAWIAPGGAAAGPANPDRKLLPIFSAAGGVTVASAGTANTQGNWTAIGTVTADRPGIMLYIGEAGTNANRFGVELGTDNSTANLCPEFPVQLGSAFQHAMPLQIPRIVANGTTIYARLRCQAASANNLSFHAFEIVDSLLLGFANAEHIIAFDTANTRPSTTNAAPSTSRSGASAYTTLAASTARAYGAGLFSLGENGTAATVSQLATMLVGVGAAGSEVEIGGRNLRTNTSTPYCPRGNVLIQTPIASGARIGINPWVPTTETTGFKMGGIGFW